MDLSGKTTAPTQHSQSATNNATMLVLDDPTTPMAPNIPSTVNTFSQLYIRNLWQHLSYVEKSGVVEGDFELN